jgi:hypothetical protein
VAEHDDLHRSAALRGVAEPVLQGRRLIAQVGEGKQVPLRVCPVPRDLLPRGLQEALRSRAGRGGLSSQACMVDRSEESQCTAISL